MIINPVLQKKLKGILHADEENKQNHKNMGNTESC
jgi:hypothetical protein